jgi:uridine kinase
VSTQPTCTTPPSAGVPDIWPAVEAIIVKRAEVPPRRSVLVALTGIDGSGKGYLAVAMVEALRQRGVRAVSINVDGWLNLPHRRFNRQQPAEHFYQHAIRFDELFEQLIVPLRDQRSHRVVADFAEEAATTYRKHTYAFEDVDAIVLEGIYLLKRAYRHHFDLAFWVECTFETALERAIQRGQEGLSPGATIQAYETIYFPAQEIHFRRDDPRSVATAIVSNDARLDGRPM